MRPQPPLLTVPDNEILRDRSGQKRTEATKIQSGEHRERQRNVTGSPPRGAGHCLLFVFGGQTRETGIASNEDELPRSGAASGSPSWAISPAQESPGSYRDRYCTYVSTTVPFYVTLLLRSSTAATETNGVVLISPLSCNFLSNTLWVLQALSNAVATLFRDTNAQFEEMKFKPRTILQNCNLLFQKPSRKQNLYFILEMANWRPWPFPPPPPTHFPGR